MSKAEERALEAYPRKEFVADFQPDSGPTMGDWNECNRRCYIRGYEQAEEDIIALVESRILSTIGDAQPRPVLRAELQELITRIKNEKD